MDTIRLNTLTGSSSIVYVCDSIAALRPLLVGKQEVIVIVDRHLDVLYPDFFTERKIVLDISESKKNLTTIDYIIDRLLQFEADRNCFLLGVGGGVMTDIVGLAASLYKRGVQYASLPTSLLSQIDASIGGKTGVNYQGYKNIIGTFYQPIFSYINIDFLRTLPIREFLSGAAELLKTFLIADKSSYDTAVELLKKNRIPDKIFEDYSTKELFKQLIKKAILIKCRIVEKDEQESGVRRLLNLGHTFGHAIEKCSSVAPIEIGHSRNLLFESKTILHGEAVSIGIVIAAKISNKLGFLDKKLEEKIINDLTEIDLPIFTSIPHSELLWAVLNDKKREGSDINFVLLNNIGSCFVSKISVNDLERYINDLC